MARLDGLRGLLALYVMLGHAAPFADLPRWLTGPLGHGEAAVDLFFCLSGLVVINSLEARGYRAGPFLLARIKRLAPAYWAVLGLAVGLLCLGSPPWWEAWVRAEPAAAEFWTLGVPAAFGAQLVTHVLLLQGLVPQGVLPWAYVALLGPAWSLSTEWQFYVMMALVLRRGGRLAPFAYAMAGLGVGYHALAGFLPAYWQFSRAFLPDAAAYFGLGLASNLWLRRGDWRPFAAAFFAVVWIGAAAGEPARGLIGVAWLLALAAQIFDWVPLLPRVLDSRAARFLGVISYSLYLVNEPVQRSAAMLVAPWAQGDARLFTLVWLPLALGGPVIAAVGLHRWVERPFMWAPAVSTGAV